MANLDERIERYEKEFARLGEEIRKRSDQIAILNREIGELRASQEQVRGAHAAIADLKKSETPQPMEVPAKPDEPVN